MDFKKGRVSAQQAEQQLKGVGKQATATGGTINKMGSTMGAAFGLGAFGAVELARQIGLVTKESVQLALKAQGIKIAFSRINDATILDKLRKATQGTVSDLVLMQNAIKAQQFKIPLNELAKLLQFANLRAAQTGKSVEDLSEKLIDGLGKKSARVLSELNISQEQWSAEIKRTGDFALALSNIIDREIAASGGNIDTVADKFARFSATIENLKLQFGELLLQGAPALDVLSNFIGRFSDASLGEKALLLTGIGQLLNLVQSTTEEVGKLNAELDNTFKLQSGVPFVRPAGADLQKQAEVLSTTILDLKQKIEDLRVQQESLNLDTAAGVSEYQRLNGEILGIENRIDSLTVSFREAEEMSSLTFIKLAENVANVNAQIDKFLALIKEGLGDVNVVEDADEQLKTLTGTITGATDALRNAKGEAATLGEILNDQAEGIQNSLTGIFTQSLELIGQQRAAALAQIGINQAIAISEAVKDAQVVGITPVEKFGIYLAMIAQILGGIAQAKAALSQSQGFAEGVIDLQGAGTSTSDSIPAKLSKGESVMTAEETNEYNDVLWAIRKGNFDDYIQKNLFDFVNPGQVNKQFEKANTVTQQEKDYSMLFYRQYMTTGEGNYYSKNALKVLKSIDRKLNSTKSRYARS